MCCYHPALHLLSQINPTTTSTARPLTLRTSLKVTWPCRCGGVPGLADPQLVTLISGEAPWWAAELLYQRRKEEGERMEGWRKASGGKKAGVAGQWSIPEDLWTKRTPSFSHTHKHKHTLCILKKNRANVELKVHLLMHNKQLLSGDVELIWCSLTWAWVQTL